MFRRLPWMDITYTVATIWLAAAAYQNYRSNDIIKDLDDPETIDKEKLEKKRHG